MFNSLKKRFYDIPVDKWLHFVVSLLATFALVDILAFFKVGPYSIIIGEVIVFFVGLAKELYDKTHGGVYDVMDIVANFIGIFVATMFIILTWTSFGGTF